MRLLCIALMNNRIGSRLSLRGYALDISSDAVLQISDRDACQMSEWLGSPRAKFRGFETRFDDKIFYSSKNRCAGFHSIHLLYWALVIITTTSVVSVTSYHYYPFPPLDTPKHKDKHDGLSDVQSDRM